MRFIDILKNKIRKHRYTPNNVRYKDWVNYSQEKLGWKKVKVRYITDNSIHNLKEDSLIFFKNNISRLKREISRKSITPIQLFKIKRKREYGIFEGGNNRVFFVKNFKTLVGQDSVWAEVMELTPHPPLNPPTLKSSNHYMIYKQK